MDRKSLLRKTRNGRDYMENKILGSLFFSFISGSGRDSRKGLCGSNEFPFCGKYVSRLPERTSETTASVGLVHMLIFFPAQSMVSVHINDKYKRPRERLSQHTVLILLKKGY